MSDSEDKERKRPVGVLGIEENHESKRLKVEENVHIIHSEKSIKKVTAKYENINNDIESNGEVSASERNIACDSDKEEQKLNNDRENVNDELKTNVISLKLLEADKIHDEEAISNTDCAMKLDLKAEVFNGDNSNAETNSNNALEMKKDPSKSDSTDQNDETSTIKSEGSEKENIDIKKENPQSPDVIMLSDEEELRSIRDDDTPETADRRAHILKKIKALQNQLRNEEATLVLLKKLRQSQITQPQEAIQQVPAPRPPLPPKQLNQYQRPHRDPPPLVRGNQPISKTLNVTQSSQMWGQQMNNQSSRSQQGPPPLVMLSRSGSSHGGSSQQQSHASHGIAPQNISRNSDAARSQQRIQQQTPQQQTIQKPSQISQALPQPQDTQTPAQRQAAAKQALRKQLEKTLLQIPPPKPPPPEMNFIPSLACPDFILLLGLEEVVNHMIDFQLIARGQKNPDERFVCTPFTCVQCGSDFTPVWKREKPGSKNVICEHCVTTNQKKALKQEHTNRLKSAFVKALQQEQEIERMQASTPTLQPSSSSTPQPQHSNTPLISAASAAAAAASAAAAAAVANFRPSVEQLRQHHNFFQQAAQLRAGQPLGLQAFSHRAPFPYNIPFAKQQDLQRQYLLDMIPRGSMPWKQ